MFNKSRNSCQCAKSYYEIICSREIKPGFCIAVLYKGCSLQFAYRGFFRALTNMNLPKERWCMENLLLPGHLQHPEPLCAHIFCKHIIH
jgi:hypothetical protein